MLRPIQALKIFNKRAVYRITNSSPKYTTKGINTDGIVLSFTQELSFMVPTPTWHMGGVEGVA